MRYVVSFKRMKGGRKGDGDEHVQVETGEEATRSGILRMWS